MSDIVKRLRVSVGMEAYNGDAMERSVCANQMREAAIAIERLRVENTELREYKDRSSLIRKELDFGASSTFNLGDRVRKLRGSSWQGRIVGFYSTALTPEGYCVESEREPGSVQIYPVNALECVPERLIPDCGEAGHPFACGNAACIEALKERKE